MDIYVGNLPYEIQEQALSDLFSEYGTVENVKIISDFTTGKSKGFAFITMNESAEAEAAIKALDGHDLDSRALKVNAAREKTPNRRPSDGGGYSKNNY